MKIISLLCFYDEAPTWIAANVASHAKFAHHVVAVDGAYFLFPEALERPRSPVEQHDAVIRACEAMGMGWTLYAPQEPWMGNEIEKRSFMFRVGMLSAEEGDWFVILDADEVVTDVPFDLKQRLSESDARVAAYWLWAHEEVSDGGKEGIRDSVVQTHTPITYGGLVRGMYRADETLRVVDSHYGYTADVDGQPVNLWETPHVEEFTGFRIRHLLGDRSLERRRKAQTYYDLRDELGVEAQPA